MDIFCSDSASGHAFIQARQSKDSQESLVCLAACAVHLWGRIHFFGEKSTVHIKNAGFIQKRGITENYLTKLAVNSNLWKIDFRVYAFILLVNSHIIC